MPITTSVDEEQHSSRSLTLPLDEDYNTPQCAVDICGIFDVVSNYIHIKQWDTISHQYPNFKGV